MEFGITLIVCVFFVILSSIVIDQHQIASIGKRGLFPVTAGQRSIATAALFCSIAVVVFAFVDLF